MSPAQEQSLSALLSFLSKLSTFSIPYTLTCVRDNAVMVQIAIPGERWEVEFLATGDIEIERFRSDGTIANEGALSLLWEAESAHHPADHVGGGHQLRPGNRCELP